MVSSEIQFNKLEHIYTLNARRLTSVTQAIGACGLTESQWYTESSRERGRKVHLVTQMHDEDDLVAESVDPRIMPYYHAYLRFSEDTGFVPDRVEQIVYNESFDYVGTLDRTGQLSTGELVIFDIKTGQYSDWWRIQVAGYTECIPDGCRMRRFGLQLKPDGQYKCHWFPAKQYRADVNDWLSVRRVAALRPRAA